MTIYGVEYKWFWFNDNAWVAYSQAQSDSFENAYALKPTQIKVDSDRFIDISLSHADIVKNFTNINDQDLIGIQRRYDDHMKRRAVKRCKYNTPLSFFSGTTFCFMFKLLGSKPSTTTIGLESSITTLGGTIATKLGSGVNYLVVLGKEAKSTDATEYNKFIAEAESCKAIPIESNYIKSCVDLKKKISHSTYVLSKKPVPVVSVAPAPAPAPTPAPTPAPPVAAPAKKLDSSYLLAGSEWTGFCTVDGEPYPMMLKADTLDTATGEVHGTLAWATLGGAITKFKGTVKDGKLEFEEYELVSGDPDEIELPNTYSATVSLESITGTVDGSNFQLKLTKSPAVTIMKPFTNYKGKVTQHDNFKLKVTKREDEKVSGTLHWPYYSATAEFEGIIQEETIIVKQYKEGKELGPEIKVPFNIVVTKVKDQINMQISF